MRYLIFILFLLTLNKGIAQTRQQKPFDEPSPKENLLMEMANECVNTHKYDRKQRLNFYPFNRASRIEVMSFKKDDFIPVKKRKADYDAVHEHQELSADQIDKLTDILYNVNYDPTIKLDTRIFGEAKCYEPRNGILFLNKKGEAFEYIEICFECRKTRSSFKKNVESDYCNQKLDLLKDFFKTAGIKYVEDERNAILPYDELLKLDTADLLTALKVKLDDKLKSRGTLDSLAPVERKIFFLLNARSIGFGRITGNGLADFYYNYSGAFAQQTADALAEVGAEITLAVLKSSLTNWPEGKVPVDIAERRKHLVTIIDDVFAKWEDLEATLYFHDEKDPEGTLTSKEDLGGLILGYIMAKKELLKE